MDDGVGKVNVGAAEFAEFAEAEGATVGKQDQQALLDGPQELIQIG